MNSEARCILTAGDIQRALDRMGAEIVERNRGIRDLALVGIRTRGEFLAQRLQQSIAFHAVTGSGEGGKVPVGVLDTTIHRDDYDPLRGEVQIHRTEIAFDVEGLHLILVMSFGRPSRISLAVLVDREGRELPISADFCGREISTAPDERVKVLLQEVDDRDEVLVIRN
jgi:pyrimidine operon attenuation protein/uracil phosphoribosyltransferase